MPSFASLPPEITSLLAGQLQSQDFFHFRQTCREANEKTLPLFIERYFRTRYVMLERRSLEALLRISRHAILGPSVQALEVCIDHLTDPSSSLGSRAVSISEDGDVLQGGSKDDDRKLQAYRRCLEDQTYLQQSGLDMTYLALVMEHLHNCSTVVVNNNSRPWGARHLARQTGVFPHRSITLWDFESIDFVKRVLRVVLEAASISSVPLQELDISFGFLKDHCDCVSPDMLVLPEPCAIRIRTNLTSLTCLRLVVNPDGSEVSDGRSRNLGSDLVEFINLFSSLSRLELSFEDRDEHELFPQLCDILYIPALEVLELGGLDCTEDELAKLLLRHKGTLKSVVLDAIEIIARGGSWQSLLFTIRDALTIDRLVLQSCVCDGADVVFRDSRGDTTYFETDGDWRGLQNLLIEKPS